MSLLIVLPRPNGLVLVNNPLFLVKGAPPFYYLIYTPDKKGGWFFSPAVGNT